MEEVGAVVAQRFQVVAFEKIEGDEFGRSLAGGGILVDLVAAIVDRNWRLDFGGVFGEIFVAEQAAVGLGERRQFCGDVAFVEAVARGFQRFVPALGLIRFFGFDQLLQSAREIGILENLAGLRRVAVGQIDFDGRRILENFLRLGDVGRAVFAQRETVLGQVDGGLQHLLEAHRAPAIEQGVPGVHDAGQAAGEQAVALGNFAAVVFLVPLDGRELGSARLGIDGIHFLVAGVVDEQDRVAAHAVEGEVGDRQRGLAADGGVEGVAAGVENPARGFGGLGFHGGNGGVASANDGAHGLGGVVALGEN